LWLLAVAVVGQTAVAVVVQAACFTVLQPVVQEIQISR
jgi:hypothetical protein